MLYNYEIKIDYLNTYWDEYLQEERQKDASKIPR